MGTGRKRRQSNYLVQGSILAAASIIVRLIGAVYRIPLTRILGDRGNSYYSCAFELYSMMLLISSYSLPLAVSKLVAARIGAGQRKNAQRIYKGAMVFAGMIGTVIAVITYLGADFFTGKILSTPESAMALKVITPAIVLVAFIGVYRGYFQGMGTMMPTAVSQIIEQVVKTAVGLLAAYYMVRYGMKISAILGSEVWGAAYGAAGATFGVVAASLVTMLFLMWIWSLYRRVNRRAMAKDHTRKQESYKEVYRILFLTIVPVVLSTAVYNISGILDQGVFKNLMYANGFEAAMVDTQWGIFSGKFKVLTNIPIAIASAMAASTVPVLTRAMAEGAIGIVKKRTDLSIRFTMILTIPCAAGFFALAAPVQQLLFHDSSELPAQLLRLGAVSVVFYSLSTLTNGILQGINRMRIPVRNAAISLVTHLAFLVLLLQVFHMDIKAVIWANIFFSLMMCILNGLAIRKHMVYRQEIRRTFVIPALSSAVMGIAVFLIYTGLMKLIKSNTVSVLIAIVLGALIYMCVLLLLKGVNEQELQNFPKGNLIARIAKKMHIL